MVQSIKLASLFLVPDPRVFAHVRCNSVIDVTG
jgi:hypothetical protein